MKNRLVIFYNLFIFTLTMTSCEVIADIFNAGVAVGVFIVLIVVALIIYIVARIRRR